MTQLPRRWVIPCAARRRRLGRHEDGLALVLTLFVVLLLLLATALLAAGLTVRVQAQRQIERGATLTALLDAALAESLAQLWPRRSFPGFLPRPFGDGEIGAVVEPGEQSLIRVVRVWASVGGQTRAARAWVRVDSVANRDPPEVRRWRPEQAVGMGQAFEVLERNLRFSTP